MRPLRPPLLPLFLLLAAAAAPLSAAPLALTPRSELGLGSSPAELSGLTWLGGDRWLAVSDKQNGLFELAIPLTADGSLDGAGVGVVATDTLGGPVRDYEGIAWRPATGTVLVSEEGTPAVREFDRATWSETADSPLSAAAIFASDLRGNRGFESLDLHPAGTAAWTGNEEALLGDGPAATLAAGTLVRLQRYDLSGTEPEAAEQIVYEVDPIHATQTGSTAPQSGLADIAVLPDGRLLALERSVIYNRLLGVDIPSFEDRIYLVDPSSAAPVGVPELPLTDAAQTYEVVSKSLLWSGNIVNLEGLALGPTTSGGLALLGVTDNQSSSLLSTTLVSFELSGLPELDVDRNGVAEAARDGAAALRYLFEFRGAPLAAAVDPGGARTDPAEIADLLDGGLASLLDVDANGDADALSDGVVIYRYLAGLRGPALVADAVDPAGARTDPVAIAAFLSAFLPRPPDAGAAPAVGVASAAADDIDLPRSMAASVAPLDLLRSASYSPTTALRGNAPRSALAVVPEPSGWLLTCGLLLAAPLRRRRRRR